MRKLCTTVVTVVEGWDVSQIFGFNTDTKVGDTVYHVQSEARENDLLLQTQVFVQGQCMGKRASSYAERTVQPGFSIELMHELLKAQHRMMPMRILLGYGGFWMRCGSRATWGSAKALASRPTRSQAAEAWR